MAKLKLTIACGDYDRTQALKDGTVQPEGVELNYLRSVPGETFWRMLNNEEFDASEMSLSSYTILRSQGDTRFTAIPVFPSRTFRHNGLYINAKSGIRRPQDLRGKRIGVGDYEMTASVWVRAFLQHDYQVKPEDMRWVAGGSVRGVQRSDTVDIEPLEPGKSLEQCLEVGEIDALISVMIPKALAAGSRRVRRMFKDFRKVEVEYYKRTGIFPIMHTFAIKTELLQEHPWLAVSLYKAFVAARDRNYKRLYNTDALPASLPWLIDDIERTREVFGRNLWDYSIEGSRPTLEAFVGYMHEQGLTQRRMTVEELFTAHVSDALAHYLQSTGED
jgi:4,5-dihydroxyphthalate decarboxylase